MVGTVHNAKLIIPPGDEGLVLEDFTDKDKKVFCTAEEAAKLLEYDFNAVAVQKAKFEVVSLDKEAPEKPAEDLFEE